jgi:carbamoyl-phosphate synthase small subunit
MKKSLLALADGTVFEGYSFGADHDASGEVVFHTGMTGYQEMLTDPSNCGQIVVMTCSQIGNYGINLEDMESWRPWAAGLVVRECCAKPSNWRATTSLPEYLQENSVPAIQGVDTRMLTRHLRRHGAQMGVITTQTVTPAEAVRMARELQNTASADCVMDVTVSAPRRWLGERFEDTTPFPERLLHDLNDSAVSSRAAAFDGREYEPHRHYRVLCIDCGVKYNILRHLHRRGCEVIAVPADYTAEQVMAWSPDGVLLSNGPGDPDTLDYVADTVQGLLGQVPIFGICLGHQILARVFGGQIFRLVSGHRSCNHPVKNVCTGQVEITTQNHGYCVDLKSLSQRDVEVTHLSLNDGTCEGLRHRHLPAFSVQYHPEAGPGPHDSNYLFDEFLALMAVQ